MDETLMKHIVLLLLLICSQSTQAANYVQLGGVVDHIGSSGWTNSSGFQPYNERNNQILGFEAVDDRSNIGLGVLTFNNSYGNPGELLYASKYWSLNESVDIGFQGGLVRGYKDWQLNSRLKIDNLLHLMVAPVVKVETGEYFTQVAAYGNAIVLTWGFTN
jgi:hypothetical protein